MEHKSQSGGDKHVLCTVYTGDAEKCPGNGTNLRKEPRLWPE